MRQLREVETVVERGENERKSYQKQEVRGEERKRVERDKGIKGMRDVRS